MGATRAKPPAAERLDSWKEISAYLKRDPRTLQRWEKSEGLPVHRHVHDSQTSVYAFPAELDAWLAGRTNSANGGAGQEPFFRRRSVLLWTLGIIIAAAAYPAYRYVRPPVRSVHERHLLRREDVDMPGLPSWDGRFVPYRTTDAEMHIFELDTGRSRLVMKTPQAGNYVNFAASPDGRQVAYDLEFPHGPAQLRVVSTDNSEDRLIFTDPKYQAINPWSWSADGNQIAAMLWSGDGTRSLALVNARTNAVRIIYSSPNNPGRPRISPDGRYVAFNEKGNILVIPAAGGVPTEAVSHPAMDMIAGWAPDGRLVFTSDRSGKTDLYAVKLRAGRPDGLPDLIRRDVNAAVVSTARNGSVICTRIEQVFEVYTAELDEAGTLASGPAPLANTGSAGANRQPDYSWDGQFLAYISGDNKIRIRSLANSEERALPVGLAQVDQLRWYPDGKAILARGRSRDNQYGFYRLDIFSADLTPVLTRGVRNHPAVNATFSPDGNDLYYLALAAPAVQVLMRLDLRTGATQEIYRPDHRFLRMYALSPDGLGLALLEQEIRADKTVHDALYQKLLSGGKARLRSDGLRLPRAFGALAWAADGKSILYHQADASAFQRDELLRVGWNAGPPRILVTTDTIWGIAVHPDGRRIAWQANGRVWDVLAVEHLFGPQ